MVSQPHRLHDEEHTALRERRERRFVVALEAHVSVGEGSMATFTRDISKSGVFVFATTTPPIGSYVQLALHPSRGRSFHLQGLLRYRIPEIGAGVAVLGGEDLERYQSMVGEIAEEGRVWNTLRGYVADDVLDVAFDQKDLVPVGDRCEALRLLFDREPPQPLASAPRPIDVRAKTVLAGMSSRPVGLKLHDRDRLRQLHVAVTTSGQYVALIPPTSGDVYTCYALQGLEQIVVRIRGRPVYPYIDPLEVAQARMATTQDLIHGTSFDEQTCWRRFDEAMVRDLEAVLRLFEAETRVYQVRGRERTVRILRHVPLLVRSERHDLEGPATLVHDGKRFCALFGLEPPGPLQVRPLDETDHVHVSGTS